MATAVERGDGGGEVDFIAYGQIGGECQAGPPGQGEEGGDDGPAGVGARQFVESGAASERFDAQGGLASQRRRG